MIIGKEVEGTREGEIIDIGKVESLLGLQTGIPVHLKDMIRNMRVTFARFEQASDELNNFYKDIKRSFERLGVETLEFDQCLDKKGKLQPNIAVFVAGKKEDEAELMVNHVSSLYKNPIIGIYEGEAPAHPSDTNQEKLDKIISILAYDVVHIAIFVNDNGWAICTMNGSIIQNSRQGDLPEALMQGLVPKLTAQVIPPDVLSDIEYHSDRFDPQSPEYEPIIDDLIKAAQLLKDDGLIMSHTSVDSLKVRDRFHERIVRAYLDNRTGMSYGFMVWQLPVVATKAMEIEPGMVEEVREDQIVLPFQGKTYVVDIPEVQVLSTRSGCDKTNLTIEKDIVRMGLQGGQIYFDKPKADDAQTDIKPSYDTLAILAHAVANVVVSSLLKLVDDDNTFSSSLDTMGLSIFHWHGYLSDRQVPNGYSVHGIDNPSVSCSTQQSAVYSFLGKIQSIIDQKIDPNTYLGDVHIELHHGTNISSVKPLAEIVRYLHNL